MKAYQALTLAILLASQTTGPALAQSTQQNEMITAMEGARMPSSLDKASRDIKAMGGAYGELLPDIVAVNDNLYVYLVQQLLIERGLRSQAPTGLLTADTIAEINNLCAEAKIADICSAGPLSPAAAGRIGALFDGAMAPDTTMASAPATPAATMPAAAPTPAADAAATQAVTLPPLLGGPQADLDGDGSPDSPMLNGDWLYLAKADGTTRDIGSIAGMTVIGMGDVDGDGVADVVLRRDDSGWLFAIGTGSGPHELGEAGDSTALAMGDFDGKGSAQVLLQRPSGWLFVMGTGPAASLGNYEGLKVVAVEDHDGDGIDDILLETASGWRGYRLSSAPDTVSPA